MYSNEYCQRLCMSICSIDDIDNIDEACFMWTWTDVKNKADVKSEAGSEAGCKAGFEAEEEGQSNI